MHNKHNVLESSHNHPPDPPWENCLPQDRYLVSKRLGTAALGFRLPYYFYWQSPHYKVSYDISLNVPSLKYLNNSEFLCQAKNTQIEY